MLMLQVKDKLSYLKLCNKERFDDYKYVSYSLGEILYNYENISARQKKKK